jgi:glutathione S-transferase
VPQFNPLGKVPTLVCDEGRAIYDSPVIVEYLDALGSRPKLIPEAFDQRIEVRRWEALGDGIAEATVLINHEYREPAEKQRARAWFERQRAKIARGLATMEKDLGSSEFCFGGRFHACRRRRRLRAGLPGSGAAGSRVARRASRTAAARSAPGHAQIVQCNAAAQGAVTATARARVET